MDAHTIRRGNPPVTTVVLTCHLEEEDLSKENDKSSEVNSEGKSL
jgi:hypothetical protein